MQFIIHFVAYERLSTEKSAIDRKNTEKKDHSKKDAETVTDNFASIGVEIGV